MKHWISTIAILLIAAGLTSQDVTTGTDSTVSMDDVQTLEYDPHRTLSSFTLEPATCEPDRSVIDVEPKELRKIHSPGKHTVLEYQTEHGAVGYAYAEEEERLKLDFVVYDEDGEIKMEYLYDK